jgi:pseudaminic acid synthase
MKRIKIGNKYVGGEEPVFIVAEISCNHLQKRDYALKLIEEAKGAGADAVKFQTYTPDTITINSDKEYFKIKGTIWEGKTLYELYSEAYTPWEWFPDLKDKAKDEDIIFFSSPFDETAVDLLERLDVPAYKIASFEINHIPLIKYVAEKKKPVIISTGVSSIEDIELALDTIRKEGNEEIIVLKCTSAYPAPFSSMNLRTINYIEKRFGVLAGLSDHSTGIVAPVVAVSQGAKFIEKHFTLDRTFGGPDAKFSLEPKEFRDMVTSVRNAEKTLGTVGYELEEKAKEHRFLSRSIFIVADINPGEVFTESNIRVIRPGHGLHPKFYEKILGKKASRQLERGTPLTMDMVEEK